MEQNDQKSYLQQLADQIVEWDKQLDDLKIKAKDASAGMKEDYARMSDDLRVHRAELEKKMAELKKTSGEGWEELKKGADKAVTDMADALGKAIAKFKK